ncbi:MAG: hypothetical protein BRC38_10765 [Cyanobacteria bacterium QH_6_48_35]|nr:MAG: hypothetical protein BRC38_10765 [Cyanobacteria bacterium QH_6_48_35]
MDYSGAGNNPTVVLLRGLGLSFLVTFFGQLLLPIIPNIISGAVYRRTLGWFEAGVTNSWKMGVISPGVATQTMPNPKIWQSADRAVGWVIAGALDDANRCSPGLAYLTSTSGWAAVWLTGWGFFCIEHFTLRLVLCCTGKIPWNYARFVDYATECSFLHKVGSGYIFVHRQLREHFAAMSP